MHLWEGREHKFIHKLSWFLKKEAYKSCTGTTAEILSLYQNNDMILDFILDSISITWNACEVKLFLSESFLEWASSQMSTNVLMGSNCKHCFKLKRCVFFSNLCTEDLCFWGKFEYSKYYRLRDKVVQRNSYAV